MDKRIIIENLSELSTASAIRLVANMSCLDGICPNEGKPMPAPDHNCACTYRNIDTGKTVLAVVRTPRKASTRYQVREYKEL